MDAAAEDATAKPEAPVLGSTLKDATAEPEAPAEPKGAGADAEDALADPTGEEPAAEPAAEPNGVPAAEPHAESALPHINNFYATSREGSNERIWDLDAWQDMLQSKCPELHLVSTEGT